MVGAVVMVVVVRDEYKVRKHAPHSSGRRPFPICQVVTTYTNGLSNERVRMHSSGSTMC